MRLGWEPPLSHALCHSLIRPAISSALEEVGLGVTSRKGGRWSNPCPGSQGADVRRGQLVLIAPVAWLRSEGQQAECRLHSQAGHCQGPPA